MGHPKGHNAIAQPIQRHPAIGGSVAVKTWRRLYQPSQVIGQCQEQHQAAPNPHAIHRDGSCLGALPIHAHAAIKPTPQQTTKIITTSRFSKINP
jgi:hypothetical protein